MPMLKTLHKDIMQSTQDHIIKKNLLRSHAITGQQFSSTVAPLKSSMYTASSTRTERPFLNAITLIVKRPPSNSHLRTNHFYSGTPQRWKVLLRKRRKCYMKTWKKKVLQNVYASYKQFPKVKLRSALLNSRDLKGDFRAQVFETWMYQWSTGRQSKYYIFS